MLKKKEGDEGKLVQKIFPTSIIRQPTGKSVVINTTRRKRLRKLLCLRRQFGTMEPQSICHE